MRRQAQGGPKAAGRAVGGEAPRPAMIRSRAPASPVRAVSSAGASRTNERREAVGRQPDRGKTVGRKPGCLPKPAKPVPASGAKRGGPEEGCQRYPAAGAMPRAWREGNRSSVGAASSRARTGKWPLGHRSQGTPGRCRNEGAGAASKRGAVGLLLCRCDVRCCSAAPIAEPAAQALRAAAGALRCNEPGGFSASSECRVAARHEHSPPTECLAAYSRFLACIMRTQRSRLPQLGLRLAQDSD